MIKLFFGIKYGILYLANLTKFKTVKSYFSCKKENQNIFKSFILKELSLSLWRFLKSAKIS
jgi:hypothetical protein